MNGETLDPYYGLLLHRTWFQTQILDPDSGPWFWTLIPDPDSGPWFRTLILDTDSGPWFQTLIWDPVSGLWLWTLIPNLDYTRRTWLRTVMTDPDSSPYNVDPDYWLILLALIPNSDSGPWFLTLSTDSIITDPDKNTDYGLMASDSKLGFRTLLLGFRTLLPTLIPVPVSGHW